MECRRSIGSASAASQSGQLPVRAISLKASNNLRVSAFARPWTVSAIRSAEATLIAHPLGFEADIGRLWSASNLTQTWTRSPHIGLSPLAVEIEAIQPNGVPGAATVIQDDFLVEVTQIVETVCLRHTKNSRTRISPSVRASISAWVV